MSQNPFSAMRSYRELPSAFGAGKMVAAALARIPYAMLPLGIMTAFTAATGDIAVGGLATAFFSVAVAVCSPLVGRAADIWGQRRVLMIIAPVNALAILALFLAAINVPATPLIYLICLLAGMTGVPVGSFTRARWVGMHPNPKRLTAAFSYESTVDEFVFVLGPAFVGIAATAAAPAAPLLLSFIIWALAGIPFALTAPVKPLEGDGGLAPESKRPTIGRILVSIAPAIVALIALGTFFGSTQAGITVRAEELGSVGSAGLVYASMGVSSGIMALLVVALPDRFKLSDRFIVFGLAVAALTMMTSGAQSLPATALWFLATGIFIGPTLVTAFTVAERLAPPGGIAVAMTLLSSSVTIGVSIGSATGGRIAEASGSHLTFVFAAVAILTVAVIGFTLRIKKDQLPRVAAH
ncbi:MFS transporter [Actinomyces minihominis]|uniref:MFS transporter n=1 Tax=Actinomyces minihominis TaxID=2002838 RepID=UPI00101AECE4|nr:MFS transporter [Actinomyces minihominis]